MEKKRNIVSPSFIIKDKFLFTFQNEIKCLVNKDLFNQFLSFDFFN